MHASNFRCIVLLFFCMLLQTAVLVGQVWPGDISNNGEVNGVDWLYYGAAFGASGGARSEVSFVWAEHNSPNPWFNFFTDGHNFSFADCNGDGVVDENDGRALLINFGLEREEPDFEVTPDSLSSGFPGMAPALYFGDHRLDTFKVLRNQVISIPISLGDADIPVEEFYGLRFKMNVAEELTGDAVELGKYPATWIGPTLLSQDVFVDDLQDIDVGITRFDQKEVTVGQGRILQLSIIIEGNVIFFENSTRTFHITLDSLKLVDKDLKTLPLIGDTLTVIVYKDSDALITSTNNGLPTDANITIFPNPANGNEGMFVQYENLNIKGLRLYNIQGQLMYHQKLNADRTGMVALNPPDLPPGIYTLSAIHETGIYAQKVIIQ